VTLVAAQDGLEVVAVVTQNVVVEMCLTPGAPVTALVKASVVMLSKVM
jgi:molybdopterin-binding protein